MSPRTINFFKGFASTNLFPKTELQSCYSKILLDTDYDKFDSDPDNQNPLTYGTDPGNFEVRKEISSYLARKFNIPTPDPDCLNLTNGASFGIGVVLNRATNPKYTKRIFIVSPCYYLINYAFVDAGFGDRIVSINETPESQFQIDLDHLEKELKLAEQEEDPVEFEGGIEKDVCERADGKLYKSAIYIVPTFSNPGGLIYSEETKLKLLELARKYNMLIICDDVYDLLEYTGKKPMPRLVHMDRETCSDEFGNVVSNSTTSKIVAPGLRFGWLETAKPSLAEQFSQEGCTKSGGSPSQLSSFVIKELMSSGKLDLIVENFTKHFTERSKVMVESIQKYLPPSTKFYGGTGGYFIWVSLDQKYNLKEICDRLENEHGIILASGTHFEVVNNKQGWENCVRLCFSFLPPEDIEYGIKVWGSLLN